MRITIQMIADERKLAPANVFRALSNNSRISAKTKELVQKTARRLQYIRNHIAPSLLIHGIEVTASKYGYLSPFYPGKLK